MLNEWYCFENRIGRDRFRDSGIVLTNQYVFPVISLAGVCYIFARERLRSLRLVRPLADCLGVLVKPRTGLDYHLQESERATRRLTRFREQLASRLRDPTREEEFVNGALETARTLLAIHDDL